jgi:lipopolysaccharide export system ATP-binding protein
MTVLAAKHLAKSYHSTLVVKDISLQIQSGEIVGLLGPNGAGKTTSFYMLVGLIPCDSGHVFLDAEELTHLAMHDRASLGISYLPQQASVFRKLSVVDNLMAILELQPDLTPQQRQHNCEALLAKFNLEKVRDSLGMVLSGGERRRVEIARALAIQPKFILLDEPFAGIDPISVIDIKELIRNLSASGIGVLISDHNVRETLTICDRAYIVSAGEILAHGLPADILQNHAVRQVYLGNEFTL